MWNTIVGSLDGCEVRFDQYMWDEADPRTQISSMARVTGFTAASAAVMLGSRKIKEVGIVAPEDGVYGENYDRLITELKDRNIEIMETVSQYFEPKIQVAPVQVYS
jgi:saccharopine dehydrogenase-like NADP-dependent oxidoreductase